MSAIEARFLGQNGDRFLLLHHRPDQEARKHIIYLPPMAEEMNRCRAVVSAQARQLAEAGYSVVLMDYRGTGDSQGLFEDGSFDRWCEDVSAAIGHLRETSKAPIVLWGTRLGCNVALEYLSRFGGVDELLFWSPIVSGRRYVKQLFRQRIASQVGMDREKETVAQLRECLSAGSTVEVGGYSYGEELIQDIENFDFANIGNLADARIHWIDCPEDEATELSRPSEKALDQLRTAGAHINLQRVVMPPLWSLHKRDQAPQIIEKTMEVLR